MATKNYSEMSVAQLETLSAKLAAERAKLSDEHKVVAAALTAKRSAAKAQAKLAAMNPAERDALVQLLQAGSIDSGEQFGQIGG